MTSTHARPPQYPLLAVVSEASTDAKVLFDFNDGVAWAADGINLGSPTLLGDPGAANPEYSYRTLSFKVNITATEGQVLSRYQVLARVMLRDGLYVLYRLSPTSKPVWFPLVRSALPALSTSRIFRDRTRNTWSLDFSLTAQAFALGERETFTVTVLNNPNEDDGIAVTLPPIKGDAPAPLTMRFGAGSTSHMQPLVVVTPLREDITWPGAVYAEAEDLTPFGGATAPSNPGYSGGAVIYHASPGDSWTQICAGSFAVPFAGRWLLYARAEKSGTGAIQLKGSGEDVIDPRITDLAAGGATYVDLGEYVFPRANIPSSRPYSIDAGNVGVSVRKTTGSPGVLVDLLLAIPVDLPLEQAAAQTALIFRQPFVTPGSDVTTINSAVPTVETLTLDSYYPVTPNRLRGEFPRVVPGATNVLHLLTRRGDYPDYADAFTDSQSVTCSYNPQYIWLPGD